MTMPHGEEPEYVAAEVRRLLADHPDIGELSLDVHVRGSDIVVQGSVATPTRKDLIASAIADAFPDHQVENDIEIQLGDPAA